MYKTINTQAPDTTTLMYIYMDARMRIQAYSRSNWNEMDVWEIYVVDPN